MPSVSIRLQQPDTAGPSNRCEVALQMSGLLVLLSRSDPTNGTCNPNTTSAPQQLNPDANVARKLKDLYLSLTSTEDFLADAIVSDSQLGDTSWWLNEFPKIFLRSPAARQVECVKTSTDAMVTENGNEGIAIQALRHACLFVIERNVWSDRFKTACQSESRRQVYNLAYGLSHEINNPLANIAARAQQLIPHASNAADRKSLATIVDQAMRAHEMVAEMMLAVQPPTMNSITNNLNEIIVRVVASFAKTADKLRVGVDCQLPDFVCKISCDATAMAEAISIGIRNALEAARPGDHVLVAMEIVRNGQDHTSRQIRIAVIDNGPGMSPQALEKVWDLYYSGREAGRGLGLGIAKLRRIIEAHQGQVWIDSVPGGGTSVEIRLPTAGC